MTKPLVFNYGHYERLRDYANDLLLDNQQLMEDNRKLRKENAELKTLNDGYVKIIAKNQETNNKLMASVLSKADTTENPKCDYISRADAIEAVCREICDTSRDKCETMADGNCGIIQRIEALPSADRPTLKQTDTLIIADALRYLADDEERHEKDRATAKELREQILAYGASMCPSADRPTKPILVKTNMILNNEDFERLRLQLIAQNKDIILLPAGVKECDRPSGEWVDWLGSGNEWECSVCKCSIESHGSIAYKYCPMCGAYMGERKDK